MANTNNMRQSEKVLHLVKKAKYPILLAGLGFLVLSFILPLGWMLALMFFGLLLMALGIYLMGVAVIPTECVGFVRRMERVKPRVLNSGLVWVIPFIDEVVPIHTKVQTHDYDDEITGLLKLRVKYTIKFRIKPSKVWTIVQNYGSEQEMVNTVFKTPLDAILTNLVKSLSEDTLIDYYLAKPAPAPAAPAPAAPTPAAPAPATSKGFLKQYADEIVKEFSFDKNLFEDFEFYLTDFVYPPSIVKSLEDMLEAKLDAVSARTDADTKLYEAKKVADGEKYAIEQKGRAYKNNPEVVQIEKSKNLPKVLTINGDGPSTMIDVDKIIK